MYRQPEAAEMSPREMAGSDSESDQLSPELREVLHMLDEFELRSSRPRGK